MGEGLEQLKQQGTGGPAQLTLREIRVTNSFLLSPLLNSDLDWDLLLGNRRAPSTLSNHLSRKQSWGLLQGASVLSVTPTRCQQRAEQICSSSSVVVVSEEQVQGGSQFPALAVQVRYHICSLGCDLSVRASYQQGHKMLSLHPSAVCTSSHLHPC